MSANPTRIGRCSLCSRSVYRRGENGHELVRDHKNRLRQQHAHKKPYTIIPGGPIVDTPQRRDDGDDEYRYWHDQAPWFVR